MLGNKSPPTHLLLGPRERGKLPGAAPSQSWKRGSEPGTNPARVCGQSREQGKLGTEKRLFTLSAESHQAYKIKARQSEPLRAEARGTGTFGQVRASGCGLEAKIKIKSKIGIQQPNSSHPLPAKVLRSRGSSGSCDREALKLLGSCTVPSEQKDTNKHNA